MGEGLEDLGLAQGILLLLLAHLRHEDLFDNVGLVGFDLLDEVGLAVSSSP